MQARAGSQSLTLNGDTLSLTCYRIDGANYVRLRDLAAALDCGVGYDAATRAVTLLPDERYAG